MDTWQGRNNDPVTLHKYLYGNVDPVNHIDPSGNVSLKSVSTSVVAISFTFGSVVTPQRFIARAEEGIISSDMVKIQNKFDETVKEMNENGFRYPGFPMKGNNSGRINNILSSTVCPNYYGCGEQALYLLSALNKSEFNLSLETLWFKDLVYEWGTWEHIVPHQYLILTPALDSSITFKLDPWANTTEIRYE